MAKRKRASSPAPAATKTLTAVVGSSTTPATGSKTNTNGLKTSEMTQASDPNTASVPALGAETSTKAKCFSADGSQHWKASIHPGSDLKTLLNKAASKLAVPTDQTQQLRLAHVRDGGREVDIWDEFDFQAFKTRALANPAARLQLKVYPPAGSSKQGGQVQNNGDGPASGKVKRKSKKTRQEGGRDGSSVSEPAQPVASLQQSAVASPGMTTPVPKAKKAKHAHAIEASTPTTSDTTLPDNAGASSADGKKGKRKKGTLVGTSTPAGQTLEKESVPLATAGETTEANATGKKGKKGKTRKDAAQATTSTPNTPPTSSATKPPPVSLLSIQTGSSAPISDHPAEQSASPTSPSVVPEAAVKKRRKRPVSTNTAPATPPPPPLPAVSDTALAAPVDSSGSSANTPSTALIPEDVPRRKRKKKLSSETAEPNTPTTPVTPITPSATGLSDGSPSTAPASEASSLPDNASSSGKKNKKRSRQSTSPSTPSSSEDRPKAKRKKADKAADSPSSSVVDSTAANSAPPQPAQPAAPSLAPTDHLFRNLYRPVISSPLNPNRASAKAAKTKGASEKIAESVTARGEGEGPIADAAEQPESTDKKQRKKRKGRVSFSAESATSSASNPPSTLLYAALARDITPPPLTPTPTPGSAARKAVSLSMPYLLYDQPTYHFDSRGPSFDDDDDAVDHLRIDAGDLSDVDDDEIEHAIRTPAALPADSVPGLQQGQAASTASPATTPASKQSKGSRKGRKSATSVSPQASIVPSLPAPGPDIDSLSNPSITPSTRESPIIPPSSEPKKKKASRRQSNRPQTAEGSTTPKPLSYAEMRALVAARALADKAKNSSTKDDSASENATPVVQSALNPEPVVADPAITTEHPNPLETVKPIEHNTVVEDAASDEARDGSKTDTPEPVSPQHAAEDSINPPPNVQTKASGDSPEAADESENSIPSRSTPPSVAPIEHETQLQPELEVQAAEEPTVPVDDAVPIASEAALDVDAQDKSSNGELFQPHVTAVPSSATTDSNLVQSTLTGVDPSIITNGKLSKHAPPSQPSQSKSKARREKYRACIICEEGPHLQKDCSVVRGGASQLQALLLDRQQEQEETPHPSIEASIEAIEIWLKRFDSIAKKVQGQEAVAVQTSPIRTTAEAFRPLAPLLKLGAEHDDPANRVDINKEVTIDQYEGRSKQVQAVEDAIVLPDESSEAARSPSPSPPDKSTVPLETPALLPEPSHTTPKDATVDNDEEGADQLGAVAEANVITEENPEIVHSPSPDPPSQSIVPLETPAILPEPSYIPPIHLKAMQRGKRPGSMSGLSVSDALIETEPSDDESSDDDSASRSGSGSSSGDGDEGSDSDSSSSSVVSSSSALSSGYSSSSRASTPEVLVPNNPEEAMQYTLNRPLTAREKKKARISAASMQPITIELEPSDPEEDDYRSEPESPLQSRSQVYPGKAMSDSSIGDFHEADEDDDHSGASRRSSMSDDSRDRQITSQPIVAGTAVLETAESTSESSATSSRRSPKKFQDVQGGLQSETGEAGEGELAVQEAIEEDGLPTDDDPATEPVQSTDLPIPTQDRSETAPALALNLARTPSPPASSFEPPPPGQVVREEESTPTNLPRRTTRSRSVLSAAAEVSTPPRTSRRLRSVSKDLVEATPSAPSSTMQTRARSQTGSVSPTTSRRPLRSSTALQAISEDASQVTPKGRRAQRSSQVDELDSSQFEEPSSAQREPQATAPTPTARPRRSSRISPSPLFMSQGSQIPATQHYSAATTESDKRSNVPARPVRSTRGALARGTKAATPIEEEPAEAADDVQAGAQPLEDIGSVDGAEINDERSNAGVDDGNVSDEQEAIPDILANGHSTPKSPSPSSGSEDDIPMPKIRPVRAKVAASQPPPMTSFPSLSSLPKDVLRYGRSAGQSASQPLPGRSTRGMVNGHRIPNGNGNRKTSVNGRANGGKHNDDDEASGSGSESSSSSDDEEARRRARYPPGLANRFASGGTRRKVRTKGNMSGW